MHMASDQLFLHLCAAPTSTSIHHKPACLPSLPLPPFLQRSQEDAILVACGLDAAGLGLREELTVGDNMQMSQLAAPDGGAVVGSAPQAQHPPAEAVDLGSQQVSARPAQVLGCNRAVPR